MREFQGDEKLFPAARDAASAVACPGGIQPFFFPTAKFPVFCEVRFCPVIPCKREILVEGFVYYLLILKNSLLTIDTSSYSIPA
jgi:hypothetical protein